MKAVLLTIISLYCGSLVAQTGRSIQGRVLNERSEPVEAASVHVLNGSDIVITDSSGTFRIQTTGNRQLRLQVTATGYAATIVDVTPKVDDLKIVIPAIGKRLDEVVVIAQKKEEVLQTVPAGISHLSARDIQDFRLWDSRDLTAISPALYSANPGDNRNVISIRGITSTSYDPAVATYIDGVNQFSLDTYISPLYDIERIEVLRGPQGTLFGRNAMGGVINIVTRKPADNPAGFVEASAGQRNRQWRLSAGYKAPIIKQKLYFGIAGLVHDQRGFYTNDFNGKPYDKQIIASGNYYLLYKPTHNWQLNLNFKHLNGNNKGAFPLVIGMEEALANPFHLNQNAITTMQDNTLNASLSVLHQAEKFRFSSQTAFQQNKRIYQQPIDADFSPLDAISIINDYGNEWNRTRVITEELRLSSPEGTGSRLQWNTGLYLFYQKSPVHQSTRFGQDANLIGIGDSLFTTTNISVTHNTGAALYGELTYNLHPKWDLRGGLRAETNRQQKKVSALYMKDGMPEPMVTLPDTSAHTSYTALSPRASIGYKPAETSYFYFSYSRGFRTGGLTDLSSDPSQPPLYPYDPEYGDNLELGWKSDWWKKKLQVNLAAFYSIVNDAQVPALQLPDAITVIKNTGKLRSRGMEAEVTAVPFSQLQFQYNFAYTDSRYQDYKTTSQGTETDLSGNRQVFTPATTSLLAVQYMPVLSRKHSLSGIMRAEWYWLGTTYFDLANSIRQPAYHLVHLRAGVSWKKMEAALWVRNLFDTRYVSYAYDFGGIHLGDPSNAGITWRMRF